MLRFGRGKDVWASNVWFSASLLDAFRLSGPSDAKPCARLYRNSTANRSRLLEPFPIFGMAEGAVPRPSPSSVPRGGGDSWRGHASQSRASHASARWCHPPQRGCATPDQYSTPYGGSVTIRCGWMPPRTRSTSVATVLSPQRRRCRPSSHRSPVCDTGLLRHRRRVVGVRQPRGPLGQQILQFQIAEPGKRQIKAAERQC